MRRDGGAADVSLLRARRLAAAVLALALLLLVAAQLALPPIAAQRIRSKLGRYGTATSASVSAWPAVKLLWGDADSARVRVSRVSLAPAQAAALLWEARGVHDLDVSAARVALGRLQLEGATLHKRGALLRAEAHASAAAVRAALPPGVAVRLLRSGSGQVEVQAGGALFGLGASLDAIAAAEAGRLVVRPAGGLFGGLHLTLFSDRHVHVTALAAHGDGSGGYRLSIEALLG